MDVVEVQTLRRYMLNVLTRNAHTAPRSAAAPHVSLLAARTATFPEVTADAHHVGGQPHHRGQRSYLSITAAINRDPHRCDDEPRISRL